MDQSSQGCKGKNRIGGINRLSRQKTDRKVEGARKGVSTSLENVRGRVSEKLCARGSAWATRGPAIGVYRGGSGPKGKESRKEPQGRRAPGNESVSGGSCGVGGKETTRELGEKKNWKL